MTTVLTLDQAHSYHSYVDLDIDLNSGLLGPQIVYASGQMNATMLKYKEFSLLYMIYKEGQSFLSAANAQRLNGNHSAEAMSSKWGMLDTEHLWSGDYSSWHPQLVNMNSSYRFSGAASFRKSLMRISYLVVNQNI